VKIKIIFLPIIIKRNSRQIVAFHFLNEQFVFAKSFPAVIRDITETKRKAKHFLSSSTEKQSYLFYIIKNLLKMDTPA